MFACVHYSFPTSIRYVFPLLIKLAISKRFQTRIWTFLIVSRAPVQCSFRGLNFLKICSNSFLSSTCACSYMSALFPFFLLVAFVPLLIKLVISKPYQTGI